MKTGIKKYLGIILAATVVGVCILCIFLQNAFSSEGFEAEIKVSGEVVRKVNLKENSSFKIQGKNDIVLDIVVNDGAIYVKHSDCPDKICEQRGKISKTGENIICLPAKTVIEVISGEKNNIDN